MKIGLLKEKEPEKRVALTPESVIALVDLKFEVLVEQSAGKLAYIGDDEFVAAGATIEERDKVLGQSDLLFQISSLDLNELNKLSPGKIIVGALNPFGSPDFAKLLRDKKITSFSMELVPRISRAQSMDILSSMATVAGYKAVLAAASTMPRFFPMFMSAAGTIKPAKMLILGAGVAGLQAIAIARKLGAIVEVFDVRSAVKEEVMSLGGKFIEVEGATEDVSAGGYAVEQTEEFKKKQGELIQEHARKADVVICTAQIPGRTAPVLVRQETVRQMRPGSIIIDLAASTGGNCELTENDKTIEVNGVRIVGESNYPNDLQIDASSMFGRNLVNFIKVFIDENGEFKLNFEDEIIKGTCLTHAGEIVNERVKSLI